MQPGEGRYVAAVDAGAGLMEALGFIAAAIIVYLWVGRGRKGEGK